MKLAMYQMKNEGTMNQNVNKTLDAIKEAALNNASIILFPEVQLTEFFPQYQNRDVKKYALTLEDEIIVKIREYCKKYKIIAVPNIYLKEDNHYYDASIIIDENGEILGVQKMVHIASFKNFYEDEYYEGSNEGFKVFHTSIGKIGIVVCFDRHYSESVRSEAMMNADLILIPTVNTKDEPLDLFEKEIQVEAFQNSVYIAMCNRVGKEDQMDFAGESLIVSPNGETLFKADDKENILYYDFESIHAPKKYLKYRKTNFYL